MQFNYERRVEKTGRPYYYCEPDEDRIRRRKKISGIMQNNELYTRKLDQIIDFFKYEYEPAKWKGIGIKARLRLFKDKGGTCMWCGKDLLFTEMTVEHIKTRMEGGEDDCSNLGIACVLCNSTRDGDILDHAGYLKKEIKEYTI